MRGVLEDVRRCLVDRHSARASRWIRFLAGVQRERIETRRAEAAHGRGTFVRQEQTLQVLVPNGKVSGANLRGELSQSTRGAIVRGKMLSADLPTAKDVEGGFACSILSDPRSLRLCSRAPLQARQRLAKWSFTAVTTPIRK